MDSLYDGQMRFPFFSAILLSFLFSFSIATEISHADPAPRAPHFQGPGYEAYLNPLGANVCGNWKTRRDPQRCTREEVNAFSTSLSSIQDCVIVPEIPNLRFVVTPFDRFGGTVRRAVVRVGTDGKLKAMPDRIAAHWSTPLQYPSAKRELVLNASVGKTSFQITSATYAAANAPDCQVRRLLTSDKAPPFSYRETSCRGTIWAAVPLGADKLLLAGLWAYSPTEESNKIEILKLDGTVERHYGMRAPELKSLDITAGETQKDGSVLLLGRETAAKPGRKISRFLWLHEDGKLAREYSKQLRFKLDGAAIDCTDFSLQSVGYCGDHIEVQGECMGEAADWPYVGIQLSYKGEWLKVVKVPK